MFNLCLPMKVINITQHSGGSYSHPNYCLDLAGSDAGVDFCYALGNYWRCISGPWGSNTYFFSPCDENGNAIATHCADGVDRRVTMALTHSNFQYTTPPVIGKVYKSGEVIYSEGTYGQATGNHVHLEVAAGLQYSKYYDEAMGVYRMHNELKPESVFYICDTFSTVLSMGGAVMKHCDEIHYDDPLVGKFTDGYQMLNYQGQMIHVYKQSGKEKIGLVSCENGTVIDITQFKLPGKKIKCIVNANYFIFGGSGEFLGRVQGFLNDSSSFVDARPPAPAEKGKREDKGYMDLVITKEGNISFGDFYSWDYPIDEVILGTSPAGIEIANGMAVNKYSPAVGYGKISNPNTQTMLMRCPDGKFALGVVSGQLAPIPDLRTWGLIYALDHLSIYDSGGSSQMLVNGNKIVYTKRKIPVCLFFYEDEDEPTPTPFPTEAIGEVVCQEFPMHIRETIGGKVLTTIQKGASCELLGFVDGLQEDGYQWIMTKRGKIVGFSQYDSTTYWVKLYEENDKL